MADEKVDLTDPYGNVAYVVDSSGQTFEVPKESLTTELRLGSQLASPEQILAFQEADERIKKFGTGPQAAATAAEQFGSTLTFGGTTMLERAMGVPAADIRARAETNPTAALVGEGAGYLAPALVTGGGSAAVQGGVKGGVNAALRASGPGLAMRLGEAAGEAALHALPQVESGIVKQALRKGAAGAVTGAVEGAAVGAGEVLEEAALGDPKLNAQSALSTIGLSTLLGGTLGGAFSGVGAGVSESVKKARDAGQKALADIVEKYPGFAAARGHDEGLVAHLAQNRVRIRSDADVRQIVDEYSKLQIPPRRVEEFVPENLPPPPKELAEDALKLSDAIAEQKTTTVDSIRKAFDEFRPEERKVLSAAVDDEAAKTEARRLFDKVDEAIAAFDERPKLYPAAYREKLKEIQGIARQADTADATAGKLFNALDDLKGELDPLSKFGRDATPDQRAAVDVIRGLRAEVKNSLENPEVWNQIAVRQKGLNSTYSDLRSAEKDFNRYFATKKNLASGGVEFIPDPKKFEQFLENLGRPRNAMKEEAFARWTAAQKAMHDEIELSSKVLPGKYEREAVDSILGRTKDRFDVARQTLAANEAAVAERESVKASNVARKARAREERVAAKRFEADRAKDVTAKTRELLGDEPLSMRDVIGVDLALRSPLAAVPIAAYKMGKFLQSPAKVLRALGTIERMAVASKNAIDNAASTLARAGVKAGKVTRAESVAGLAKSFALPPAQARSLFAERKDQVERFAQDPALAADHFARTIGGDLDDLPETSVELQATAYRAISYLYEKLPKPPARGVLGVEWTPSDAQMREWNRLYETVSRPVSVLKDAAAGTLTKSQVEALAAVHPETLVEIQTALLEHVASERAQGHVIPYTQQRGISLLLGEPVTSNLAPDAVIKNQMSIAQGNGPAPQTPMPKPGMQSVSLGARTATSTQKAAVGE